MGKFKQCKLVTSLFLIIASHIVIIVVAPSMTGHFILAFMLPQFLGLFYICFFYWDCFFGKCTHQFITSISGNLLAMWFSVMLVFLGIDLEIYDEEHQYGIFQNINHSTSVALFTLHLFALIGYISFMVQQFKCAGGEGFAETHVTSTHTHVREGFIAIVST